MPAGEVVGMPAPAPSSANQIKVVPLVLVGLLTVLVGVYFLILPGMYASSYTKKVTDAYKTQSEKMSAVFANFGSPAFADENTTQASDIKDFDAADSALGHADTATSALKDADKLTLLPGTTGFGAGKDSAAKHKAMQQYLEDSQAFLAEYHLLVNYARGLENVAKNDFPPLDAALASISSAKTLEQLRAASLESSAQLTKMINDTKKLHPPADLKDFNAAFIADLSELQEGQQAMVSGIDSRNSSVLNSGVLKTQDGAQKLSKDASVDMANKLQHTSQIHTDIQKLKSEKPLSSVT